MSHRRKGITLVEMVCVVAVLVVVASISIPLIKPMMESRGKDAAADVIRARWSQLRSKAINNGKAYSFECKPDTGKFRMVSEEEDSDDAEVRTMPAHELELPNEIKFAEAKIDGGHGAAGGWTKVATFLPDGTARNDAEVTIGKGPGSITLKLHGATGVVSAAEGANGKH